jgi:hypothetical protein
MTFQEMHEIVKTEIEYAHLRNYFKRAEDHIRKINGTFTDIYGLNFCRIKGTIDEARAEFDKVKVEKKIIDNQIKLL